MVQRATRATQRPEATRTLSTRERLVERRAPDGSVDPVARSAYVRRYESELADRALAPSSGEALAEAVLAADLILLGEYHPLPGASGHAEALLRQLVDAGRRPHLGVEFAQGRDQRSLDAFGAGAIGAAELREHIAWEREWGYPWGPASRLLEEARSLGVPITGLDVAPRGGARDLGVRDRVVARRLARLLEEGSAPIVVVFGEAHLAADHLPLALERELGEGAARTATSVRVFHDLPAGGPPKRGSVWAFDERTFLTYPAGAQAREGALAEVWSQWAAATPSPRLEQEALLHALARMQLDALGLDSRRTLLPGGGVLADLFPRFVLVDEDPAIEGAVYDESEGVVLAASGSVGHLARGAGDFCASALAARARVFPPRKSREGEILLACIGEALARLADPMTESDLKEREDAFAVAGRLPDSIEQGRLLGGALGRRALRGQFKVAALARAAKRAPAGASASKKALKALVFSLL